MMKIGLGTDSVAALSFGEVSTLPPVPRPARRSELISTRAHIVWMGADLIAALGPSICHVRVRDMRLEISAAGAHGRDGGIEIRPAEDAAHRARNYLTHGRGHDET